MSFFHKVLRKLNTIQEAYFPLKEFDSKTLPWIDQPNPDIDAFLKNHPPRFSVPYNMGEKLNHWHKNGYAVLEQIVPSELIDAYWDDFQRLVNNPEKHDLSVRIDLDKFLPNQQRNIKEFPKEDLLGKFVKINDFHNSSVAGKQLMAHPSILAFLEAVFNQQITVLQSLIFMYGSQQPTHQDFPWVTSKIPSHLAAAWIAMEDIQIDSGPLYYYVGSHKMPKFDFGTGILHKPTSTKTPLEFASYLEETCQKLNYPREILLIKKGDVLIWHGALAHGGSMITNPNQTRKSFVCHYSSTQGLPYHRNAIHAPPIAQDYNGMLIYNNPLLPQSEDVFPKKT